MGSSAPADEAIALVDGVPGWLTDDQARVLHAAASRLAEGGRVVEIGSHHGRSTIVLAHAARAAGARVVAVDPFPADWRYGSAGTEEAFRAGTTRAGVADVVDLMVATSAEARAHWQGPVHLLYVDGKHDYWSLREDLRWVGHVPDGGTVLVHDAFSSVGVTLGLLRELLPSRRLSYVGRTGSLARLRVATPTPADRARVLTPLPWFVRNLVVKVLLRLRLRPLARLLGHRGAFDPY